MNRRHIEARVQRTLVRWMGARLDGYALQFNEQSAVDRDIGKVRWGDKE